MYQYQVGSDIGGWSQAYTFMAKRDFSQLDATPQILIFGDLGTGEEIVDTVSRLSSEIQNFEHDVVIHLGDIAYDLEDDDGRNGDDFLN